MSGVRFFAPEHPVLARTVRARLEKHRAERIEQLGNGNAQDFPDYRHRVGVIRGIDLAIQACTDVENDLARPEYHPSERE